MENRNYYLAHHGIVGMKWGKRNGPPYPLNASTHNKVVKRANKPASNKVGGVLSMAINTSAALSPLGMYVNKKNSMKDKARREAIDSREGKTDHRTGLLLKSRSYSEYEDAKLVNPGYKYYTGDTRNNCLLCSLTYDQRRRGYDVIAKLSRKPMPTSIYGSVFGKYYREHSYKGSKISNAIRDMKNENGGNSRGIITVHFGILGGHAMNYSVTNGSFKLIDAQSGDVYDEQYANRLFSSTEMTRYFRTDNIPDTAIDYKELKRYME